MIHTAHFSARFGRQVALPLAVVFALGGSLRASTQAPQDPDPTQQLDAGAVRAIEKILTPPITAKPDATKMAAQIAELGRPGLEVVVALMAGELPLSVFVQGSLEEPVHPLALEQRQVILGKALTGFGDRLVIEHLRERLAGEPEMDQRLLLISVLGSVDNVEAFDLLLDAAGEIEPIHLQRNYVQSSIEKAIAAHLRVTPRRFDELDLRAGRVGPEMLAIYARSAGATHSSRGIESLAGWVGRSPGADAVVLTQIGRVAGEGGLAVSNQAMDVVRRQLRMPDVNLQRAAAVALGRLRDEQSFGDLVDMLENGKPQAAGSAHWSLKRISGIDLGKDPEAWKAWREREADWWKESAPALIDTLHSDAPGLVMQAVGELLQHPLQRHLVAEALGPLVVHSDPAISRGVCLAIVHLDSTRAVPWLIDALMSSDLELRAMAGRGLNRLTGQDLPPEYIAWTSLLAG